MSSDLARSPKEFIEDIRTDYANDSVRSKENQQNSCDKFANDLYEKKTHFIFELIQNAEDNAYRDGDNPALRFRVLGMPLSGQQSTVLVVQNNEVGFLQEQVDALCKIGKSTKTAQSGYIGEKGIGFKSVFKVTDCPCIHSNGFHFCLPRFDPDTGLGYIVPRWLDHVPDVVGSTGTTILLPLVDDQFNAVTTGLSEIVPETILFLSKLKTIEIEVNLPDDSYEIVIEKDDSRAPLIELTHLKRQQGKEELETRRYWVASRDFHKPPEINPEKRKNVTARPVSVAIPLDEENPHPGKLFAYLPVWEKTGLPFLINADFLLVSSREGIHEQESWNLWLRNCIAPVYTEALVAIVGNADLPIEQRTQAYSSIPTETHQQWLESVVQEIQKCLRQEACVLTSHHSDLQLPENCRWPNKAWRELLAPQSGPCPVLREKMFLVHPNIPGGAKNALHKIGVNNLSLDDQLACLGDVNWTQRQGDEWLLQLYSQLRQVKAEDSRRLTSIPLVPICEPGRKRRVLSCDNQQPIYFPLDEQDRKDFKTIPGWLLEKVPVAFVTGNFDKLLCQHEKHEEIRDWMTEALRIYSFSMTNYCVDVDTYLKDNFECLEDSQVVEVTTFLFKHADEKFDWTKLPIVLASGQKLPRKMISGTLVVTETHDPNAGWQNIWRTPEDRRHVLALANSYEKLPKSFLDKIGAVPYPGMARIRLGTDAYCRYPEDKVALSKSVSKAAWSYKLDTFIETVQLPSFPNPMTIVCAQALLKWLQSLSLPAQSHWEWDPRPFEAGLRIKGTWLRYGQQRKYFDSPLLVFLRTHPWLPTTQGLRRPSETFVDCDDTRKILGERVPYVKSEGKLSPQLIELLKIRDRVDNKTLLDLLRQQKERPVTEVDGELSKRIYKQIKDATPEERCAIFKEQLIFVAKPTRGWHGPKTLIWKNRVDLFGDEFGYLEVSYDDCGLKEFFRSLDVDDDVTVEHCLTWLKNASEQMLGKNDFGRIRGVYKVLAEKIENSRFPYSYRDSEEERKCRSEFETRPLLFDPASGNWFSFGRCLWPDKREVLGNQFAYLEPHYGDLKTFFVDRLKIKTQEDAECYAKRWLALQDATPTVPPAELHKAFSAIFDQLRPALECDEPPAWVESFKSKAKVLGEDNQFHPPAQAVLNDDGECKEILDEAKAPYTCVWLPEGTPWRQWEDFFAALEVKRLSEIIHRRRACPGSEPRQVENRFLTPATIELIACWLFSEKGIVGEPLAELYESLRQTREEETDQLEVVFDIEGTGQPVRHSCKADWERDGDPPVLLRLAEASKMCIAEALCVRLLDAGRTDTDSDTLESLLAANKSEASERIDKKNWQTPPVLRASSEPPPVQADELAEADPAAGEETEEPDPEAVTIAEESASAPETPSPGLSPNRGIAPAATNQGQRQTLLSSRATPSGAPTFPTRPHSPSLVPPSPVAESATVTPDFRKLLAERFNRPGKTKLDEEWLDDGNAPGGTVRNPERRARYVAEGHRERLASEPDPAERRRTTELLESADPQVRQALLEWYGGKCQICGRTWPERDGSPFFAAAHLVELKNARAFDDPANAICLCADHFAQWQYAARQQGNHTIEEQIESWRLTGEGGDGTLEIRFIMLGEETKLTYCEKHALTLREWLRVIHEDQAP